jgi:iron complex transport system substrate-binding protein
MIKTLRFVLALSLGALALPLLGGAVVAASTVAKPQCIVSLSPTATETLFSIGAGPQVQAVDVDSDFPKSGLPTKRINALNPSVESVLGICTSTKAHPSTKPDLVIISYDANSIKEKLTNLGVKVVDQDAATSVANALQQIRQLGRLTGHEAKADSLASSMNTLIKADIASVPAHPKKKITVYYEIGTNPYYSLTSKTFVGSLMKSLGLVNIADADSTTADAGYPELSAEYIVSANPKLVFLADSVKPSSVAKRAGFAKISAVTSNNVVELNADIASRWGPRLTVLMYQLTSEVKKVLHEAKLRN